VSPFGPTTKFSLGFPEAEKFSADGMNPARSTIGVDISWIREVQLGRFEPHLALHIVGFDVRLV